MKALLAIVLLAASAALGSWVWSTLRTPLTEDAPAAAAARPALPTATGPRLAADPTRRTAMVEAALARPLFSADRRPKQATAQAAAAPARGTALPRMTAILVDGAARTAIFAGANGKPAVVSEGGQIGGFTVQRIEPQQVTMLGPDGKRVVRTSFDPNPPAPESLMPPPAGPMPGIIPGSVPGAPPFALPNSGVSR